VALEQLPTDIDTIYIHIQLAEEAGRNWPLLCRHLATRENLMRVRIRGRGHGAMLFLRALAQRSDKTIQFVTLRDLNHLSPSPIARLLDSADHLRALSLCDCTLEGEKDDSAILASAIQNHTGLTNLDLGRTTNADCTVAILDALQMNHKLETLELSTHDWSDETF